MNRSNIHYPLNEDIYADLVCIDNEELKIVLNWLRKKGFDSHQIVTEAIGYFAMLTLLTDEEKAKISDIVKELDERLAKAIEKERKNEQ